MKDDKYYKLEKIILNGLLLLRDLGYIEQATVIEIMDILSK